MLLELRATKNPPQGKSKKGKLHVNKNVSGIAGCLIVAMFCVEGRAQLTDNILLIHGRSDSTNEQFGVFTFDQHRYWSGSPATVDGHVNIFSSDRHCFAGEGWLES